MSGQDFCPGCEENFPAGRSCIICFPWQPSHWTHSWILLDLLIKSNNKVSWELTLSLLSGLILHIHRLVEFQLRWDGTVYWFPTLRKWRNVSAKRLQKKTKEKENRGSEMTMNLPRVAARKWLQSCGLSTGLLALQATRLHHTSLLWCRCFCWASESTVDLLNYQLPLAFICSNVQLCQMQYFPLPFIFILYKSCN